MQSRSINRAAQIFILLATFVLAGFASAEPSKQDINQALKNGDIAKAETLINEVLSAHPQSAEAHFKYAEILAAEGKLDAARKELSSAEKIRPSLNFATPAAVESLQHKLNQSSQSSSHGTSPFIFWGVLVLIAIIILAVVRALRRPQMQPNYAAYPQSPNGYAPQGPYQNNGYAPQGGGLGSNIMGGLATGAAVGAGVVAGEMLMHKILDGDQPSHDAYTRNQPAPNNYDDISGSDFVDNSSSWDNGSDFSSDSSDSGGDWS